MFHFTKQEMSIVNLLAQFLKESNELFLLSTEHCKRSSLNKHSFSDYLKLQRHWMNGSCSWSSKLWTLQSLWSHDQNLGACQPSHIYDHSVCLKSSHSLSAPISALCPHLHSMPPATPANPYCPRWSLLSSSFLQQGTCGNCLLTWRELKQEISRAEQENHGVLD